MIQFHKLKFTNTSYIPTSFNNPFFYKPNVLAILSKQMLWKYISSNLELKNELLKGKMLGVLVVKNPKTEELGFLAAYSGQINYQDKQSFFTPPVYDLTVEHDFYKQGEKAISAINSEIRNLQATQSYRNAVNNLAAITKQQEIEIQDFQEKMYRAKKQRDIQRTQQTILSQEQSDALIKESQFQKAELKRLKLKYKSLSSTYKDQIAEIENQISLLKKERKRMSYALQKEIFEHFVFLNHHGVSQSLYTIFAQAGISQPPSGAGECCAPKLLQFAFLNNLRPICIAEFWYGASPKNEPRVHGSFYPACLEKCGPILSWMLKGMIQAPLLQELNYEDEKQITLPVLYEDKDLILIDKPSGLLSVPGKDITIPSVQSIIQRQYNESEQWIPVHRLDMATSGILMIAKNEMTYTIMQQQFSNHIIKKRYMAWLDGTLNSNQGILSLPICPNVYDRPRQTIDFEWGKESITLYKVIKRESGKTLVRFSPYTGRTHQLRLHAASPLGLNCAIVGDTCYGTPNERLMLHAYWLRFWHPSQNKWIEIESPCPFA